MIVDTSAILALAFNEPSATAIFDALCRPEPKRVSAANLLEAMLVVDRRNDPDASKFVEEVIARFEISVEPFSTDQLSVARSAWARFGRGSGHRAGLNFGDCFAYALAMKLGEPLLFIGQDFSETDISAVL